MHTEEILISAVSDEDRCRRTGFPVADGSASTRQYPRQARRFKVVTGPVGRVQMLELAVKGHVTSHGPGEAGERQHEDRRQEPAEYGGGVEPPLHDGAVGGVGVWVPCRSLVE
jgi:hypothetical protein